MRLLTLGALALLLLPTVQAQAPTSALAFEGVSQKYLAANETQLVPITVALTISNVVCTTSVPMKVALTANAKGPANLTAPNSSIAATVAPVELTFNVRQGAYGNNPALPTAKPFSERQTATLLVTGSRLANATSVDVTYLAKFDGYSGSDCRGSAAIGAATKEGTAKVEFAPNVPAVQTPGPELPVPPVVPLLGLAVAVLVMRRRSI